MVSWTTLKHQLSTQQSESPTLHINHLNTHHINNMKAATYFAVIAAAVPAVWSLPAGFVLRQFQVPTCGAETCLASTNGTFEAAGASNGTAPYDLGKICSLPQEDVTRYVQTVQPCIDGDAGKAKCSAGAIYRKSSRIDDRQMAQYTNKRQSTRTF